MIDYKLKRSQRKTAAIYITGEAEVEVRAPMRMPKRDIDKFVASKRDWIEKRLSLREQALIKRAAFTLDYGSAVTAMGGEYPIIAGAADRAGFDGKHFLVPPGMTPEEIKPAVIEIYKMIARKLLKGRVQGYAEMMSLEPSAVKVNSAKTRWGSCSGKNSINFSWRLVMADIEVIDYVIVHELAHIREHNHSDRFWAIVEAVMPDYDVRRKKLRQLQMRLSGEDW